MMYEYEATIKVKIKTYTFMDAARIARCASDSITINSDQLIERSDAHKDSMINEVRATTVNEIDSND